MHYNTLCANVFHVSLSCHVYPPPPHFTHDAHCVLPKSFLCTTIQESETHFNRGIYIPDNTPDFIRFQKSNKMSDKLPPQSTMIGGQRMAARKRAQSETNTSGTRTNLPPNSGFQRYYGFATSSIQMGPQAVLLLAICYMGAVVIMHIVSRIKTSI